jgi:hypothetical protein
MAEQYGTNLPGLTGYEGDVTADGGETLIGNDSDGSTALLFGPAALREIQAGVANGDFASAPDEPDADITDENPLPYFSAIDDSSGNITARVIEDASAGSGNVLRFRIASGTTSGKSLTLQRFVPVPGTRNRSFVFTPELYCINATSTSNAKVTLAYQYYELDQETATGTGDNRERTLAEIGSADTLRIASNYTRLAIPSDAAFILLSVTVTTTGTVSSQSDVSIAELRLISGGSDLYIAENSTPATYGPARIRQVNGELTITPNLGGSGTVIIDGTLDLGATTFSSITVTGSAATDVLTVNDGNVLVENGYVRALRGTAGNATFTAAIDGDSGDRIRIEADGTIEWGPGTSSTGDTNLYRYQIGSLRTDGELVVGDTTPATIFANGSFSGNNVSMTGTNGLRHDEPATTTSASNAATWVVVSGSNYQLRRNTSSRRYKTNIVDADDIVLEAARRLKPRHYESTIEDELGETRLGFIAEEIHEAGLTHAITYNADGQPESIDSVALIAALWHRVNDLETRLKALETE